MKRLAFSLFALLLLLAGCGDKDSQKEEQASTQNNKTEKTADQKDKKSEQDQKEKATTEKENQSEQAADPDNNKGETNSQQQDQQPNKHAQNQNSGNQATVNTQPSQPSQPHQDAGVASKIALAFFGSDIDHYSLTQSEIMKGVYEYQGPGMTSTRQVNQLTLKRMQDIPNAPQGMKFYTVMPAKGNFATIIGVNEDKVFVGGTQGALVDYQRLLTTGKEMNAQSLYQAHKNDPALTTITHKIQITN